MEKRWVYKSWPKEELIKPLSEAINVNPILAGILWQRGIQTFDQAKDFFRPSLQHLHSPFLMKDMQQAVERLAQAIQQQERILIYGDYDVDGTTSVSLMYAFLKNHCTDLQFYIPDRYAEGYGVSRTGVEWAIEQKIDLIICLDCGVKSIDLVQHARNNGVDFIICDHHRPGDTLPPAVAVLDPKRDDCPYPYKELSGCGVGFKLLQGLCEYMEWGTDQLYPLLDLVCVSIASDIVPITGENRIMTYFGLKQLNNHPRPGLKSLLELAGLRGSITITSLVFGVGPRINAAGRIAHAHAAVELLLAETEQEAASLGDKVNDRNTQRRTVDVSITQEALSMIENDDFLRESKSTVLFKEGWHKGVIGIVASRCIEKYYRPTVILTQSDNKATGSARSVEGFDLYDAIEACSDLLDQFGGHTYAAGLTMPLANIAQFQQKFEAIVSSKITEEMRTPQLELEAELPFGRITDKFFSVLSQMEPFGPHNMSPVFVSRHVSCLDEPRLLKEQHIKLKLVQEPFTNHIEAIGFGLGHYYEQLCQAETFHIAYTIEQNDYKGVKSLQLSIKDIKFE